MGSDVTDTSASGNITFANSINGDGVTGRNLTVDATGGTVAFDGAIGNTHPLASLTVDPVAITLAANVTTTGAQDYETAVTLENSVALSTTNSAVDFAGTLDGASSGAQSLTVNSGTAATTFGGKIGGNDPLDNLTITADSLNLGNKVYGTGLLTIQPYTASTALNINDGTSSGLYLTSTEQGYIQNDWAGIAIGSASGTGNIKVGANTWNSPVTFNDGSGTIEFSGAQTLGANTLTADSASGAIQLDSGAAITSTAGSGNSIVLAAGSNFVNNSGDGTSTLNPGSGTARWIVYSTQSSTDTDGASLLNPAQTINGKTYATEPPGSVSGAGENTWVYSSGNVNLGTIDIGALGQTVNYGTAPNLSGVLGTTYSCTGSGSACSDISGSPALAISGTTGHTTFGNLNNGTYTITVSLGSLSFDSGYTGEFSFVNGTSGNGNGLTVQLILPPTVQMANTDYVAIAPQLFNTASPIVYASPQIQSDPGTPASLATLSPQSNHFYPIRCTTTMDGHTCGMN
jgi:hypothetical protein